MPAHELGYKYNLQILLDASKRNICTVLILFRDLMLEEFLQDSSLFPQADWFSHILLFKSADSKVERFANYTVLTIEVGHDS
jgi:hypothetical protein